MVNHCGIHSDIVVVLPHENARRKTRDKTATNNRVDAAAFTQEGIVHSFGGARLRFDPRHTRRVNKQVLLHRILTTRG